MLGGSGIAKLKSDPEDFAKMSFVPVNPRPFLQDLVNKDVIVRLKWGQTEYKGRLVVRIPDPPSLIYFFFPERLKEGVREKRREEERGANRK